MQIDPQRWRARLALAFGLGAMSALCSCESQRCLGPEQTACAATDPNVWVGVVRGELSYLNGVNDLPEGARSVVTRWRDELAQSSCLAPDHSGVVAMLDALQGADRVEVVFSFPDGPACGQTRQVNFLIEKRLTGWSVSVMRYPTAAPTPSELVVPASG